ncbi:MAG: CBS domain-containing protein [Ignavibacteriaceae bacterium]
MKTVKEILNSKGREVYSVSPDTTVFEALKIMAEKGIGALLVMDGDKIVGIMSERDYARKIILLGRSSKDVKVSEIMSEDVIYIDINQHTEACMALLTGKRIRHLPVFDKGKLAGLISIGDVVKAVIDEKEFEIEQLVNYIKNSPSISKKE